MINVSLITNAGRKTKIVPDTTTLRDFYESNGVNWSAATNTINSVPIQPSSLDKSIRELIGSESSDARISSIVKHDDAAKIIVDGNSAVVHSSVKLADWKRALEYDKELGLYDEEGEIYFAVAIDENSLGSLNKYGVTWSGTPDKDGNATLTTVICPCEEDVFEGVKKALGAALLDLNELEGAMPSVLEDAEKMEQEIAESIVLM